MKKLLFFLVLFLSLGLAQAPSSPSFKRGNLIIQLEKKRKIQEYLEKFSPDVIGSKYELISDIMNSYLIFYDTTHVADDNEIISYLYEADKEGWILNAQFDHYVNLRATRQDSTLTPNDSLFWYQWALHNPSGIKATKGWPMGTGGVTALGDTVVVAVVDNGGMVTHEDLSKNIWINHNEIPGNGIDDDLNGYVDDIHGWNAYNNTGQIPYHHHGTHVAGIVGASGNNQKGVAGVNWNIKLMLIAAEDTLEHVVQKGYNYVIKMRALYDSTNGQKGAFIVATNSSFGRPGWAHEYPIWCAMYDTMGQYGILSVAATTNDIVDVDVMGDIPSTCPSSYLICVTNIDKYLQLRGGYGLNNVDLGAPGTNITSTVPYTVTVTADSLGGAIGYDSWTGTSMATPHVTGTIALMHSVASESLAIAYKNNPGVVAKKFKQWLFETTTHINALYHRSTTEGIVNLYEALKIVPRDIPVTLTNWIGGDSRGKLVLDNNPTAIPSGSQVVLPSRSVHHVRTDELPNYPLGNDIWKHHHWNQTNPLHSLYKDFVADVFDEFQDAIFQLTKPVSLYVSVSGAKKPGTIYFRDPWNYEQRGTWVQSDSLLEYQAPVVGYNVFLHQSGPPNWLEPKYEVKADSVQIISFHGQPPVECYFQQWKGSSDSVLFQYPYSTQTGIEFLKPAKVEAEYKGHLLSSAPLSSIGHQIWQSDSLDFLVYEDKGEIYLTKKLSTSQEWEKETRLSDGLGGNSSPSIAANQTGGKYCVVWQKYQSGKYHLVYVENGQTPISVPQSQSNVPLEPVVAITGFNSSSQLATYWMFCWRKDDGLYYMDTTDPYNIIHVPGTDQNSTWPVMTNNPGGWFDMNSLAFASSGSGDIHYIEYNVNSTPASYYSYENITANLPAGPTNNQQPSICILPDPSNVKILLSWVGLNADGIKKIYCLEKDYLGSWDWSGLREIDSLNTTTASFPRIGLCWENKATLLWLLDGGLIARLNYDNGWMADSTIEKYFAQTIKADISPSFTYYSRPETSLMAWTSHGNPFLIQAGLDSVFSHGWQNRVNSGWNMLALPLNPPNLSVNYLLPSNLGVYGFNGNYFSADTLVVGRGYWVRLPTAGNQLWPGNPIDSIQIFLSQGWNLIGGASGNIALSDVNDPGGIIIPGTLFRFDGYVYSSSDSIKQGVGYWLRASAAGTINLRCGNAVPSLAKKSLSPMLELKMLELNRYPTLTVKDASGARQMLYFNVPVENEQKLSYSLPPLPPAGAFDVRFSGDFRVSESEEALIQVQSSHYPIKIAVSNLPLEEGFQYVIREVVPNGKEKVHVLKEGSEIEISDPQVATLKLSKERMVPLTFVVQQNYPNPFNHRTTIKYGIPQAERVEVAIYNTLGQKVKTLVSGHQKAGYYTVVWNATNDSGNTVSSGVYFYRIKAGSFSQTRKIVLLK